MPLVITSISIETKNQAIPNVRIARGRVMNRSSGLRIVFSTPNTAAAASSEPTLRTVTSASRPATIARITALVSHEMPSRTTNGGPSGR
jgi:hypothetical protein